jgi:hypothetical protein
MNRRENIQVRLTMARGVLENIEEAYRNALEFYAGRTLRPEDERSIESFEHDLTFWRDQVQLIEEEQNEINNVISVNNNSNNNNNNSNSNNNNNRNLNRFNRSTLYNNVEEIINSNYNSNGGRRKKHSKKTRKAKRGGGRKSRRIFCRK